MNEPFAWTITGVERDTGVNLLARSATLLDDPKPLLRWYVPTDATIVLGRGQRAAHEVPGFNQVVRPSGGGAVRLDPGLLSLDVVIPAGHPWTQGRHLADVFIPVGQAWLRALAMLGVPELSLWEGAATATRLGTPEQAALAEVCYASMGRGEIATGNQKLVGLSQRQRRGGALVQCGIAHHWDPSPLIDAMGVHEAQSAIWAAATGIDDVLGRSVDDQSIIDAVNQAFTTK
ncbi:lipoate--protein ligase family protein [Stomatohabitans albus]|uniref:lipoate--protein ligase family protein n=1 Tax=Stomatohabitans albus TaxID=3110766 RepID=UPI00300D3511